MTAAWIGRVSVEIREISMQKTRRSTKAVPINLAAAPPARGTPRTAAGGRNGQADDGPTPKVVGAVVGAIKILRYLSEAREPVGVSRIAKDTQLNTSTSFNILRTLALNDLVEFDPGNKTYALSLGIMEIAKGATAVGGDTGALRPLMERIAQQHGVTVTLWQPVAKNRKVLILSALTRRAVRIQMAIGQRLPIYIGATGRVFAAFRGDSEADLKAGFNEIRWERPISFKTFAEQVVETRKRGWAVDDGNFAAGTFSVAVPVLDNSDVAIMGVTATMFTGERSEQRVLELVRDLKEFAPKASRAAAA